MPNMAQQIKQHNNKVLDSGQVEKSGGCNGHRGGKQCPVPGDCMAKGVVYGAEVTDLTTGGKETYTGLTEGTIRDRIGKHEGNFRHRHQPGIRLSDHVWKLKDKGSAFTVNVSHCRKSCPEVDADGYFRIFHSYLFSEGLLALLCSPL